MRHAAWVLLLVLLVAAPAWAAGHLIVVVGAEGEPEYGQQFGQWADRWVTAANGVLDVEQIGRAGGPDAASRPAFAPSSATQPATAPVTDKDALHAALQLAAGSTDGPLWLVLIGHGTADERGAKFNLRGPDVSDTELAEWLRPVKRPIAVIDCSSASGPFLRRLSAPNRVTIVATRSGSEYQFARFGDAISTAIIDPSADLDKDGQTSLLEAFLVASGRVDAFYTAAGRLVTEHALLDDVGDVNGVPASAFRGVRLTRPVAARGAAAGSVARNWFLRPVEQAQPLSAEAQARRAKLEAEIEALRAKKQTFAESDYYDRLERLMLELARLQP